MTPTEYEQALKEIETLMDADPEPFSEGYERMEYLSALVEKYEDENFPMGEATPPKCPNP